MNDKLNESNTEAAPPAKSSVRVYILLGILAVATGLWALTLSAKGKWSAAKKKAEEILGSDEDYKPSAFMKAIGQTPMVVEEKNRVPIEFSATPPSELKLTEEQKPKWEAAVKKMTGRTPAEMEDELKAFLTKDQLKQFISISTKTTLVQMYRWPGGIMTFELKIKFDEPFHDKPGAYAPPDRVEPSSKLFFMTDSLEGYTEAHDKTGSTLAKLTELKVYDPFSKSGTPDGGASAEGPSQRPGTSGAKGGKGDGGAGQRPPGPGQGGSGKGKQIGKRAPRPRK